MKTSLQIAQESGLSKYRVNQFAKSIGLAKMGSQYAWTPQAEKAFYDRIGKRGDRFNIPRKRTV